MNDNDKYWAQMWMVVAVCATVLCLAGIGSCTSIRHAAIEKGLCTEQNIGNEGSHWVPCGK